jgi:hypothetical protein
MLGALLLATWQQTITMVVVFVAAFIVFLHFKVQRAGKQRARFNWHTGKPSEFIEECIQNMWRK